MPHITLYFDKESIIPKFFYKEMYGDIEMIIKFGVYIVIVFMTLGFFAGATKGEREDE